MNPIFISTGGRGLARAECGESDHWSVETLLHDIEFSCLAADPRNPNVVYAGTRKNGVLRSDDRGKRWQSGGMAEQIIKSIAVSPAEPGLVYAGTKPPGIFMSRDGGQNWTELEAFRQMRRWFWFTPAEAGAPYVQGLAVAPTNPNVIVAGVEAGAVLHSADGGKTWQGHLKGAIRDCHSLTFHATDSHWVYEAGGGGAAYSRDGGATWQQPDPTSLSDSLRLMFGRGTKSTKGGLDRRYCWAVAADPAKPEVWYISASTGPFKAHGEGDAQAYIYRHSAKGLWERLEGGLPQPLNAMPYGLLTDPSAPGQLYAALSNGDVWHKPDYGEHWQQLPFNLGKLWTATILL